MPSAPAAPPKMPDKDKLSYAIGVNIATSIKRDKIDVDIDTIVTAMKDVLADHPTRMTQQEVGETITQFRGAMQAKMKADHDKEVSENKTKGEKYLAENAKAPGFKSLPDGLQYKVLAEGAGPMPKSTDNVIVNYKGRLIDGTPFDQKERFPTPVTGRTIQGWSEVLPLMKQGSKWEVVIPSELGYGQRGRPPQIGPNSVLIFEMELVSISAPPLGTPAPVPGPGSPAAHAPNLAPPTPQAVNTPVVSGQIIKVPSRDELDKGAKIEVITNVPGQ
jgi:FKBP-type peptidyl-prolyl cis-trans isomerase FklB